MNLILDLQQVETLLQQEAAEGRRIIFVDASSLKDTGCFRKFYWSTIKGYRPSNENLTYDLKIEYGSAYHKFLELWYTGKTYEESTQAAQTYYEKILTHPSVYIDSEYEFRTMAHLLRSIERYVEQYPREVDGLRAKYTEQKFAFPFWKNDKYTIMLSGTIDLIGDYHGIPIIADHKTTASYIFKNYFDQYELGIQTMFYSWIWNYLNPEEGEDSYRQVLINGIFVKKPTLKATKEGRFDGANFERSKPFQYGKEQMEFFYTWMKAKLENIQYHLSLHTPLMVEEYDISFCKTPFGMCKFYNVCKNPTSLQPLILKNNFVETTYNPLRFGGVD